MTSPAIRPRTRLFLARGILLVALAFFVVRVLAPALTSMTHSFPAYYVASRLVVEGRWSPQLYDDAWFSARVLEMTDGRVSEHFSLHPPTTSLLLVPLARFDLTTVRVIWQLVNAALLAALLWLLLDALPVRDAMWRALFAAFALLFPPLAENVRVGQIYILVLFAFTVAFWSEQRSRPPWAGIALGLVGALKLSGAPIWLMLMVRGRWRTILTSALVLALASLAGWLALGTAGWLAFFAQVGHYGQPVPLMAHVAFQTTPSFFQHLFVPSPDFNPTPLFDAPPLARALTWIVALAGLAATLWFARRCALDLAFGLAVTASVILFPMATEYHYTLLLLPLGVMGARLLQAHSQADLYLLALVLFLLCVPFDWNAPFWNEPRWTLSAYPRLYGGWLLWFWLARRAHTDARRISLAAGASASSYPVTAEAG